MTSLHRFAQHGWTERDVHLALDEVLRARGWSVPELVHQPAAYLAALLRDVDPGDRPGAYAEAQLAELLAEREWLWRRDVAGDAPQCEHGIPAGDLPHPRTGVRACALCRRSVAGSRSDGSASSAG